MRAILFAAFFALVLAGTAYAACPIKLQAQNTQALLAEIPSLNTDLQSCPVSVPGAAQRLFGSGNFVLTIQMTSGQTQQVCVLTANNQITGVSAGWCQAKYTVTISEGNLDGVLQSGNRANALLRLFGKNGVTIRANSFWTRIGFFFAKPAVKSVANKPAPSTPYPGPPEKCDETYMEGHRGYQYAKTLWDSYKADTDGVCQMQQGHYPDGHCIYSVQQSSEALIPYYICFYRN